MPSGKTKPLLADPSEREHVAQQQPRENREARNLCARLRILLRSGVDGKRNADVCVLRGVALVGGVGATAYWPRQAPCAKRKPVAAERTTIPGCPSSTAPHTKQPSQWRCTCANLSSQRSPRRSFSRAARRNRPTTGIVQ